ncbi:MAG: hypothetical protein JKY96_09485, partial [Phycisphaerales bacterium]|nr:hypothetical protein [Phycisphaerales bacterium]
VSRAERSAATMLEEAPNSENTLRVPISMVYLAVAVVLGLGVLIWTVGYRSGVSAGKAQMESLVKADPVVRPVDPNTNNGGAAAQPAPNSATPPLDSPLGTDPLPIQPGINPDAPGMAIMTASGFIDGDPRETATNYLELATLTKDEADSAIGYMNSHGVPVIGIPRLDSRRSDANNPSRYTLYSLGVAAPGDQFRTMTRERDEHQWLIASLGKQWQREFRGGSDFAVSKTQWVKYTQ